MAVTAVETPAFPIVAEGYDPTVVDAAFEAERAWRRYLEERAALLLREAQALHAALAQPSTVPAAAAPSPASTTRAGRTSGAAASTAAASANGAQSADDEKARRAAAKRKAAAEKRKATIAAKKKAAAEAEAAAERAAKAPRAVPAQPDPAAGLSPGAAWARRTSGVTALPSAVAKPQPKSPPTTAPAPNPSVIGLPQLGAALSVVPQEKTTPKRPAPIEAPSAPATKSAGVEAEGTKDEGAEAASKGTTASMVFGPVATMGPLLHSAGSGGRTESRVIRLV